MEESNKHNPRIDKAMADKERSFLQGAPVDSRADEQRRDEGAGPRPGQATADAQPADRAPANAESMSADAINRRAELATYLPGATFPAQRKQLIDIAQSENAPPAVVRLLEQLPQGQQFDHFEAAWDALPVS